MMAEREINLINLIVDILSHWRGILICMLAGALLMGGFSYVRSYQRTRGVQVEELPDEDMTPEEQREVLEDLLSNKDMTPEEQMEVLEILLSNKDMMPQERLEVLEDLLTNTEQMAVYSVIDDEQELVVNQQYVENSVIMQMDPYHIPKIDLIYKIQIDDMGQSHILTPIYEDLVNGAGLLQWVEEQTGISSVSADELVSAQAKSNITVLNGVYETESGSDCLNVTIIHYDEAECERLAQCVKDYIEQQSDQLAQELGAHEIVLLSESAGVVMDTVVRDRQLSYTNNRITLLTNIAKTKDAFTEEQQMYYNLLKGNEIVSEEADRLEEDELEAETKPVAPKPSISKKYVALGAVLFAFIYAGVFFILYILNGKLRATDELQGLYNISQLGLIVKDEEKKKFIIDRWIDALQNWNKRRFTREQSLKLAAAAIKISAGKQELNTIYLMGCDLKVGAGVACQELKERLEQENIAVKILDNVLYDAEAMEALESAQGIVLVEKAMSTMYDEILRELELASRQGIKVLGGIVVE